MCQTFMVAAPDTHVVELYSVIGRVGGKVLLTLMFIAVKIRELRQGMDG